MGEEFLKKRSDRFRHLRDERFKKLTEKDLFSHSGVICTTDVPGTVLPQSTVAEGERVWGEARPGGRSITFYRGETPVVRVSEHTAEMLLAGPGVDAETFVGVVTSVDPSNAIAIMRLCDAVALQ